MRTEKSIPLNRGKTIVGSMDNASGVVDFCVEWVRISPELLVVGWSTGFNVDNRSSAKHVLFLRLFDTITVPDGVGWFPGGSPNGWRQYKEVT